MPHLIDDSVPIPKYYQVYQTLRERIENGEYMPGTKIPSERKLVAEFAVSRITIVKAVDLLVQERLVDRQQGLGNFVLSPSALKNAGTTKTIVLAFHLDVDYFMTKIIVGATEVATDHNIMLKIFASPRTGNISSYYHNLLETAKDGLILYGSPSGSRQFIAQYQMRYPTQPLVLIDRIWEDVECDYVVWDDEKAGYDLTKRLIARGHRRIAFIPGVEVMVSSVVGRMQGYRRALEEANLEFHKNFVFAEYEVPFPSREFFGASSRQQSLQAFIEEVQPDAILAANSFLVNQVVHDLMTLKNQYLRQVVAADPMNQEELLNNSKYDIGQATVSDYWHSMKYDHLRAIAFQDGGDLGVVAMRLMLDRLEGRIKAFQHIKLPMPIHDF